MRFQSYLRSFIFFILYGWSDPQGRWLEIVWLFFFEEEMKYTQFEFKITIRNLRKKLYFFISCLLFMKKNEGRISSNNKLRQLFNQMIFNMFPISSRKKSEVFLCKIVLNFICGNFILAKISSLVGGRMGTNQILWGTSRERIWWYNVIDK